MPNLARRLPLAVLALLAGPAAAQTPRATPTPPPAADASAEPERSVAVFGDWAMRCEGRPPARACELTQTLQNDRNQPVALFAIGRSNRADPLKLVVQVPLNVAFPAAPRLVLDGGNTTGSPLALAWRQCIPAGCTAQIELRDAALLTRLRARTAEQPGRLLFQQASGGEAALPFSFRGLSAALDALPRD
ncbi:invasion associated locus B family protein [Humitalea sp. 24SJ18S-53]|uniref:invasion associated locus B family protein n=1 Tax=Humitalea sp. 24SJ18S-53 TaxID=3422307 RepID=UPI003D67B794